MTAGSKSRPSRTTPTFPGPPPRLPCCPEVAAAPHRADSPHSTTEPNCRNLRFRGRRPGFLTARSTPGQKAPPASLASDELPSWRSRCWGLGRPWRSRRNLQQGHPTAAPSRSSTPTWPRIASPFAVVASSGPPRPRPGPHRPRSSPRSPSTKPLQPRPWRSPAEALPEQPPRPSIPPKRPGAAAPAPGSTACSTTSRASHCRSRRPSRAREGSPPPPATTRALPGGNARRRRGGGERRRVGCGAATFAWAAPLGATRTS